MIVDYQYANRHVLSNRSNHFHRNYLKQLRNTNTQHHITTTTDNNDVHNSNDNNKNSNKHLRRNSNGSFKSTHSGDDNWSIDTVPKFAEVIHTMLEEYKDSEFLRWNDAGDAFTVDPHHPQLLPALQKYFDRKLS